jgi:acetolactate synthase I/II/III large subunit
MPEVEQVKVEAANLAEAYLELLALRGVDCFFSNAGNEFGGLVEAFAQRARRGLARPRPVTVPHEIPLVSMAHGYYLATGRPQVAMVHANVGSANGLGGIINANRARVPILYSAGRTPIDEEGSPGCRSVYIMWGQETFDQAAMLREYVKWDYELKNSHQLEKVLDRALALAGTEPKGPVYLTLPRELLHTPMEGCAFSSSPRQQLSSFAPDPERVGQAAEALAGASNPLIITSSLGRSPQAVSDLVNLAEMGGIGVVSFFPEYCCFPIDHPCHQGFMPAELFEKADVVLVIDCDVPWYPDKFKPRDSALVIQAGIEPLYGSYAVRSFPSDLTLQGDPGRILRELAAALAKHPGKDSAQVETRLKNLAQRHDELARSWHRQAEESAGLEPLDPRGVSQCLSRLLGEEAVVFNEYDNGMKEFMSRRPGHYFGLPHAGYLGWGFGAALGYKMARPDALVAATLGDGSYIYGVPSACHLTAASQDLPLLAVVYNNRGWQAVRRATRALHPGGLAAQSGEFPLAGWSVTPAYEKTVEAYGGHGERVESPHQLEPALKRAIEAVKSGRQALVNVICQSHEERT